jgi:hypothetical protein
MPRRLKADSFVTQRSLDDMFPQPQPMPMPMQQMPMQMPMPTPMQQMQMPMQQMPKQQMQLMPQMPWGYMPQQMMNQTQQQQQQQQQQTMQMQGYNVPPPGPVAPPAIAPSTDMPHWVDNKKKLCNSYKGLGMVHLHGIKRSTPKRFRASLGASCDPVRFPMLQLCNLDDEHTDLCIYVIAGVLPSVKPSDFGVETKGEVRMQVRLQYQAREKRNPQRMSMLSEELDN